MQQIASKHASPRAFVTGSTGFIGSHLVRFLLQQGWDVHVLVRSNQPSVEGTKQYMYTGLTAEIIDAVSQCNPDVVFHLASLFIAQHKSEQIASLVASNILLGTQLLEAMQLAGVNSLVNTGTSWQHFCKDTYRPVNLYAATKQAFEDILSYYCDSGIVRAVTLKLFDSYGPDDNRGKLLSLLLRSLREQDKLQLSGGEQILDLVHVEDICRAYLQAATLVLDPGHPSCSAYAVSGGERRTLRETVAVLEAATGGRIPVEWGAKPYRPREVMEPWNGPTVPGWAPQISLFQGFARLLNERLS